MVCKLLCYAAILYISMFSISSCIYHKDLKDSQKISEQPKSYEKNELEKQYNDTIDNIKYMITFMENNQNKIDSIQMSEAFLDVITNPEKIQELLNKINQPANNIMSKSSKYLRHIDRHIYGRINNAITICKLQGNTLSFIQSELERKVRYISSPEIDVKAHSEPFMKWFILEGMVL